MVRVGRKGSVTESYETLMSLIFLGIFAATAFLFITAHADGSAYFSRLYAADLSTSAELVNAPQGDVLLRYDNLKQESDLRFTFTNGVVAVGKSTSPIPLATGYYGVAQSFPQKNVSYDSPLYLVLRKSGTNFAVMETEQTFKECPLPSEQGVALKDVVAYLEVLQTPSKADVPEISSAFEQTMTLAGLKVTQNKDDATVVFRVSKTNGAQNMLTFGPTTADGKAVGCFFQKQLEQLALTSFETSEVAGNGDAFAVDVEITTNQDVTLRNDHIGQALATALARYYR